MIKTIINLLFRLKPDSFPFLIKHKKKGRLNALHISAFSYGNAGDTLLPVVLRDLFNKTIGVKTWSGLHVHKLVTDRDVKYFNSKSFIVIGGGGLFLKDTNPNDNSGWQWNCSIEKLDKIKKPLIAFAIGYNRFREQEEFEPIFTEHINKFVEKAVFIGLRNHGSVKAIKKYIKDDSLKEKIVYQPCMTTLISHIYPSLIDYQKKQNVIAFNCAFDRPNRRSKNDSYLRSIAKVAKELSKFASIKYYAHMQSDKEALPYFDALDFPYELIELKSLKQIIECYTTPRLVIGMRGHSQMIPFGCQTPIVSIVSHDKMQWFLDDINHSEWGIDVKNPNFELELTSLALNVYKNYKEYVECIIKEQEKLWKITEANLINIHSMI